MQFTTRFRVRIGRALPIESSSQRMDDTDTPLSPWTASRSAKAKNVVQRAVTALLDQLAPERVLKRGEQLPPEVEQHRKPNGAVAQAPTAAAHASAPAQ